MARPSEELPAPDEIADHAGFVRRLSRRLVDDPDGGDDVAQEALLAYLEQQPRPRSVRGWLATVARRISTRRRLVAERRWRRERAVARSAVDAGPAERLEQAEVVQRLLLAVLGLDAPHRQVVLMRFYQDLPPRRIAEVLGISVPAVKKRLERATARLRARILRGDDARAHPTLMALIALATPHRAAVTAGATLLPGAAIMKTKVLAGMALLIAMAVVAWRITEDTSGNAREETVAARDSASPPREDAPTAADTATTTAGQEIATTPFKPVQPEEPGWTVRGVVDRTSLRLGTAPVPEATVEATLHAGYDADSDTVLRATLTTDLHGRFVWPLCPPDGVVTLSFHATKAGHSSDTETVLADGASPPPSNVGLSIYPLSVTVTGTIRDPAGRPLAGAHVVRTGRSVIADADGVYEIDGYGDYPHVDLHAWAEGFGETPVFLELDGRTRLVEHDIVLEPACRVEGTVSDEQGLPVAGAKVRKLDHRTQAVTDADGRFVLDHLPRDRSFGIDATKPGYLRATATVELRGEAFRRDLVLKRGAAVRGIVLDPGGRPLRAAELWIGFARSAFNRIDAISGDDGRFQFSCVAPGEQTLVTSKPGYAVDTRQIALPDDGQPLASLEIRMARGGYLAGRVVDDHGQALEDVEVSANLPLGQLDARTRSDAEGRFRLERLPPGELRIWLSRADLLFHGETVTERDRDDLVFTLHAAMGLRGRVVDDATGQPVRAFCLRIFEVNRPPDDRGRRNHGIVRQRSGPWRGRGASFEDEEGRWSTLQLRLRPDARLRIEARADGYAPAVLESVVVAASQDQELIVRLRRGCEVLGRVVEAGTGLPVAGATVVAEAAEALFDETGWQSEDVRPRAQTDGRGRFRLSDLAPGEVRLLVEPPGRPLVVDGPFTVMSSENPHRLIEFPGLGRIAGLLRHGDGPPVAGAEIGLQRLEIPRWWEHSYAMTTSPDGTFSFPDLAPGPYSLTLWERSGDRGVRVVSRKIEVLAGEPTPVHFGLPGSITLRGEVVADVALPDHLCAILTTPGGPRRKSFIQGRQFAFEGLEEGTFTVSVEAQVTGRRFQGSAPVDVRKGANNKATVRLQQR